MSPVRATAEEQLERILYILPAAHRAGGASLQELSRALGVDEATVARDIQDVTAREFYHPAGTVEAFTASIEGDRVTVWSAGQFERPTRLNAREALALQLGLRVLAADRDEEDARDLLELAERIERELTVPETPTVHVQREHIVAERSLASMPPDVEYVPEAEQELVLAVGDDAIRGELGDAIERGRVCRILYLKPSTSAPASRTLAPLHLVYEGGRWYVLAYDLEREGMRLFRLDRILEAEVGEEAAPAVDAADALRVIRGNAAAYMADAEIEVKVRYAADISRWIAERTGGAPEADGSIALTHRVADTSWIVQHVLQYGGAAWIESPEHVRRLVADAAAALSA